MEYNGLFLFEIRHRYRVFFVVRRFAVPADLVFHEGNALALGALCNDRSGHTLGVLCFIKRRADLVEIMSAAGRMPDDDAVGVLAAVGGHRAGAILDAIQKRMPVPKRSAGKIVRKRGAPKEDSHPDDSRVTKHFISCTSFEENPLSPEDDKAFQRASHAVNTSRPGTKTFAKGRRGLEELLARYPDYHRLAFNYAVALLRDGEHDEAVRRCEKIVAEHPDYAFARSALLDDAILNGDFARAKELVDGYRLPARIHPLEMRNWYQALLRYAEATGNKADAKNARDNLAMLQKSFPDL